MDSQKDNAKCKKETSVEDPPLPVEERPVVGETSTIQHLGVILPSKPKGRVLGPFFDPSEDVPAVFEGPARPSAPTPANDASNFIGPPRPGTTVRDEQVAEEEDRKLRASEWDRVKEATKVLNHCNFRI